MYWIEMCHSSMKMDLSMINNKLVIVLFIRNMFNKEIHRRVAGAKNINTLLDVFKSAQMNLLKLKKYEGLVSDNDHGHTVNAVYQIMNKSLDTTNPDRSLTQTDIYGQKYIPSTNDHARPLPNQHQQTQIPGNPYQQLQLHFAPITHVVYMGI